jgi:hypothetical protein
MDNQTAAAMQQINPSLGKSGGILGAEPTPPLLDLAAIARELDSIGNRLESNHITYNQLANRIYGPVPPKSLGDTVIQQDQTAFGAIHQALSTLLLQMDRAEETLRRFDTLA